MRWLGSKVAELGVRRPSDMRYQPPQHTSQQHSPLQDTPAQQKHFPAGWLAACFGCGLGHLRSSLAEKSSGPSCTTHSKATFTGLSRHNSTTHAMLESSKTVAMALSHCYSDISRWPAPGLSCSCSPTDSSNSSSSSSSSSSPYKNWQCIDGMPGDHQTDGAHLLDVDTPKATGSRRVGWVKRMWLKCSARGTTLGACE
jgi:hypothetical protein